MATRSQSITDGTALASRRIISSVEARSARELDKVSSAWAVVAC